MKTQVPQTTVRSIMDDPANKPTPVEAYSCALSLSLESPVTDKQTKATKIIRIWYAYIKYYL